MKDFKKLKEENKSEIDEEIKSFNDYKINKCNLVGILVQ